MEMEDSLRHETVPGQEQDKQARRLTQPTPPDRWGISHWFRLAPRPPRDSNTGTSHLPCGKPRPLSTTGLGRAGRGPGRKKIEGGKGKREEKRNESDTPIPWRRISLSRARPPSVASHPPKDRGLGTAREGDCSSGTGDRARGDSPCVRLVAAPTGCFWLRPSSIAHGHRPPISHLRQSRPKRSVSHDISSRHWRNPAGRNLLGGLPQQRRGACS